MRDSCDVVRLSALLDDELDEERALDVARHAATCPTCTGELDVVRSVRSALRALPKLTAPSPMLFAQAVADAESHAERRRQLVRTLAAAAVATLATGLTVWLAGTANGGTVVPPMERFVADHVGRVDHGPLVTPVDFGR